MTTQSFDLKTLLQIANLPLLIILLRKLTHLASLNVFDDSSSSCLLLPRTMPQTSHVELGACVVNVHELLHTTGGRVLRVIAQGRPSCGSSSSTYLLFYRFYRCNVKFVGMALPRDELSVKLRHIGMQNGNIVVNIETCNSSFHHYPSPH